MQFVKNLPASAGDVGPIPGPARSPGGGNGNPLQYSWPKNPIDRGAWWARVHGVRKNQSWLSNPHTHISNTFPRNMKPKHRHLISSNKSPAEKAMAPHSSTLAWKIPWTEEPGGLQFMGSLRVGHDWATSISLFTFHFHALEKEMATHSSVIAWRIPGTGEPGGLPSLGSHRVGHDWSNLAAAAAATRVLKETLGKAL